LSNEDSVVLLASESEREGIHRPATSFVDNTAQILYGYENETAAIALTGIQDDVSETLPPQTRTSGMRENFAVPVRRLRRTLAGSIKLFLCTLLDLHSILQGLTTAKSMRWRSSHFSSILPKVSERLLSQ
jgi:hypothetical protein